MNWMKFWWALLLAGAVCDYFVVYGSQNPVVMVLSGGGFIARFVVVRSFIRSVRDLGIRRAGQWGFGTGLVLFPLVTLAVYGLTRYARTRATQLKT